MNAEPQTIQQITSKTRQQALVELMAIYSPEDEISEIKAAETFGKIYKSVLRYNVTSKDFYYYTGRYWVKDQGGIYAQQLAKEFHKLLMIYAYTEIETDSTREIFLNFYGKYSQRRKRESLLQDAVTEIAISESDFDKNVDLLNVRNGTINLKTMERQDHNPEDLLTNYIDVDYIPDAHTDLWERFISDILPSDKDLQRYMQKALGYAMTGIPELERMFILYGQSTRNGKSTLLNAVSNVLGSYAKAAPAELLQLTVRDSRNASEDLARLSKCRFLTVSEPAQNMVFDVPLIKSLTGRDTITARRLYETSFEYIPKFSIFLNTNYLPKVLDDSLFSSDRVHVIPFTRHFKPEEQDTTLKAKLQTEENKTAILAWLLEGLKAYRAEGLKPPMPVLIATRVYVQQSDKLQSFIDEEMEETDKPCMTLSECYELYRKWCFSCGFSVENKSKFSELLKHKSLLLPTATIDGKTVRSVINGYKSANS
ncbi:MAG: DNA primase [Ruminococcus sp.]|nr:DNA primase [Ruminococcus sp.]